MVLVLKLSALESSESLSPDTSIDTFGESRTFSGQFSVAVGLKKKFSIQKCQQRHLLEFIRLHFQKDALGVAICVRLFVRRLVWLFTKVAFPLQLDGLLSFRVLQTKCTYFRVLGIFKLELPSGSYWVGSYLLKATDLEATRLKATQSKPLNQSELETTESKSRTPKKCAQFFN